MSPRRRAMMLTSQVDAHLTLAAVVVLAVLAAQPQAVDGQRWKTNLGPCYRNCASDPEPRVCRYEFTEEAYASLTTACLNCSSGVEADCYSEQCIPVDGVQRSVYSINRQIPGPGIYVCQGDTIQVDLNVKLLGHAETIHWHGLFQTDTPWFDGVAWVTQCPVLFGNTFRYEFLAEKAGTFFWHSHSGLHKVNGISGVLVVYQHKGLDPHAARYDHDLPEHVMILHDWMHNTAEFVFPGLVTRLQGQTSDVLLINGQGQFTDTSTNTTSLTPLAKFRIRSGKRYRFRIINSGSLSCPIQIQFEGHEMNVIATDSFDVRPRRANTLITLSGERYDVIITGSSNAASSSAFWIYTRTVGFCQNNRTSEQRAVLLYQDADGDELPASTPPTKAAGLPLGTVLNSLGDCDAPGQVCAAALRAVKRPSFSTAPNKADRLAFIRLKFRSVTAAELFDMDEYDQFLAVGPVLLVPVLNEISFDDPSAPFLTQPGESPHCDTTHLPASCDGREYCECPHLVTLPYDKVIDLLVVDDSDIMAGDNSTTLLSHPMHLHGTGFTCMGQGILRNITNGTRRAEEVHSMYYNHTLARLADPPATKDVLALPGAGWIWLRFRSNNRGCWLFHCHFQYHMAAGMEMVFQFGETELLPKPPAHFPKCGNYYGDKRASAARTPWYRVPADEAEYTQ